MKEEAGEFGVKMNEMPKVVASSTLMDPEWENTSVISGDDLPAEVGRLKGAVRRRHTGRRQCQARQRAA